MLTVLLLQGKIATASKKTRPKRIAAEVQMLAEGQRPGATSAAAAVKKETKPNQKNSVKKKAAEATKRSK